MAFLSPTLGFGMHASMPVLIDTQDPSTIVPSVMVTVQSSPLVRLLHGSVISGGGPWLLVPLS